MKVAMIVHNPPFQGGIVQYSILLANSLKDKVKLNLVGFKKLYPPLFYKGKLPKENKNGIQFKVESNNFITWYNPLSWIKAYNKIKNSDIIHLHWVSPLLAPLQYVILKLNKLSKNIPVILTCHNIEPHESTFLDKILTKMIFSNIDHFIVHAKQSKKRLIDYYCKKEENVHVIPHGTFGFFKEWKTKPKSDLKKEFKIPEDNNVLLFFGYIRKYKGLIYLLRAFPEVLKKFPNTTLIIAGELWGNLDIYTKEIKKNNLNNNIKFYPNYILDKEVSKFFNVADILVLPYYNTEQTISGPLLVGLAFNKPIIISDVGGISEIIKDNENGLLVDGGEPSLLADKIITLLKNKSLQKNLIKNAKQTDLKFRWEDIADKHLEVYQKAVKC